MLYFTRLFNGAELGRIAMLLNTSRGGVKTAFEYLARLPFTKPLLHRLNEAARGKCVAFFSLHRILDEGPDLASHPHYLAKTALTAGQARRVLKHIKKTLPFVSLPSSLAILKGEEPMKRSVAVLIIEAPYAQTIKNVVPLALELDIPVAIALTTHSLLTGEPLWMDEVTYRIISTPKQQLVLNFIDRSFNLTTAAERIFAAHHLVDILSHCSIPTLHSRLDHVREILHETALAPTSERICTQAQLMKLELPGLSFIVAGREHIPFYEMDVKEAEKEIVYAKQELSQMVGNTLAPVFLYPLGIDKRRKTEFIKLMMDAGYTAAISRAIGICRPGDNMFRLSRLPLGPSAKSFEQFELQGLSDAIDEFLLVTLGQDKGL